jgi:hypothetical protein
MLTILGAVLLLRNFDLLNLDWEVMFKFWPLLLIYAGLGTIYSNKKTWLVPIAMIGVTILAILIYNIFKDAGSFI